MSKTTPHAVCHAFDRVPSAHEAAVVQARLLARRSSAPIIRGDDVKVGKDDHRHPGVRRRAAFVLGAHLRQNVRGAA